MGTRRQFLATSAAAGVAVPTLVHLGIGDLAAASAPYTGNTLVVVFLRGGSDGLSVLAPVADADYHAVRPTVGIPQSAALALGGPAARADFGWHPSATRLAAMYNAGKVAVVPAAGSPDHSRSHFDCMAGIESGRPEARTSVAGGWLGRYLAGTAAGDHPLRAFTAGWGLPASLRGYGAISAPSLDQLGLIPWGPDPTWAMSAIRSGYTADRAGTELATWAGVAVDALVEVAPLTAADTHPPDGWPDNDLAYGLYTIARLVESDLPVQVATCDLGDWDHHAEMGSATDPNGRTATKVAELDSALGAFFDRLGARGDRVTVVTMTEFGRRLEENDSGGVDHGWASQMLVVGGGVDPGVKGAWPGVGPTQLVDGDLGVSVDQRSVLAELLVRRLGAGGLSGVFPGFDTSARTWAHVAA